MKKLKPWYDVIFYSYGSWVISPRSSAPKNDKVHTMEFTTWTEVEADTAMKAMEIGYKRITEKEKA